jgi:hypothetical protein
MTATLDDVTKKIKPEPTAEQLAAEELVRRAREQGLSLTGPDGLLKQLTKTVLETALNQELTEHLGHERHGQPAESGTSATVPYCWASAASIPSDGSCSPDSKRSIQPGPSSSAASTSAGDSPAASRSWASLWKS